MGDARRRLRIASLACFAAMGVTLVSHLVLVRIGQDDLAPPHVTACLVTMAVCLALYFLFGWQRLRPETVINLALLAEVHLCFSTSMMELNGPDPRSVFRFGPSLVCVILVLAPSLIPAPPWKTLLAALAGASMGPLALSRTIHMDPGQLDGPVTPVAVFNLFALNYVCAGLALAPALVLRGLRTDLSQAVELGSYRLLERLGAGGMGEVWSARHRLLARPAAIKLIGAELAPDPVIRQRFEHEVQATARLRSPHTVTVYDYGTAPDGTFYYVMELMDGLDLGALVRDHGPIPPARVTFLLDQVLQSLEEAHAAGLVHRDIKPENVFACRWGVQADFVKVLDFGLALSTRVPPDARLSTPDSVQGTPAFMAPEQALQKDVDGRADLYSVACLGYWLLTGRTVFEASSPVEHIVAHVSQEPEPPGGDPELAALLLQGLSKDPAHRPSSAAEMRRRLPLRGAWTEQDATNWWNQLSSSSNS